MSDEEKEKLKQVGCNDIDDAIDLIEELQGVECDLEYYETQLKDCENEIDIYRSILSELLTYEQKLDYRLKYGGMFDEL